MTYLQRLLDTAAAAAPTLGVGAGPPNSGQSPIFSADQRLAQFPDAVFDIAAEPLLPEPVSERPIETGVKVDHRDSSPRLETPAPRSARPAPAASLPEPTRDAPPTSGKPEEMQFVPRPSQDLTTPREPATTANVAKLSHRAEPVFHALAPAPERPATGPADDQTGSVIAPPLVATQDLHAPTSWPIPATDFQPTKQTADLEASGDERPRAADRSQATPLARHIPAAASPVDPTIASPSPVQNGSPLVDEPMDPTPPRTPVAPTQPPMQKIAERIVERTVEKRAPAPPRPQTAEEVSVIGPLKGLQPGRWRYFGGGF